MASTFSDQWRDKEWQINFCYDASDTDKYIDRMYEEQEAWDDLSDAQYEYFEFYSPSCRQYDYSYFDEYKSADDEVRMYLDDRDQEEERQNWKPETYGGRPPRNKRMQKHARTPKQIRRDGSVAQKNKPQGRTYNAYDELDHASFLRRRDDHSTWKVDVYEQDESSRIPPDEYGSLTRWAVDSDEPECSCEFVDLLDRLPEAVDEPSYYEEECDFFSPEDSYRDDEEWPPSDPWEYA